METMQEGGGRLQNGSIITKTPNCLKFVKSDEYNKVTNERTTEMDPYKELELYLAKVNVSLSWIFIFTFLSLEKNYKANFKKSRNFAIMKHMKKII